MGKIKRSEIQTFLNTGTSGSPNYVLLGTGITSMAINYNPQTTDETYVNEDSGTTEVESYRPQMPVEMTAHDDDDAFAFIDALRKARAVLDDAKTDIVNVWVYEGLDGGEYPAEQQDVSIQVDDFGGEGGTAAKINFTLNFIGDPVTGTFEPTASEFTAE